MFELDNGAVFLPAMPGNLPCGRIPKWDTLKIRHRPCSSCGKDTPSVICIRPDHLKVHQCSHCKMFYLADIPGENDLSIIYKNYAEYKGCVSSQEESVPRPYSLWKKIILCRNHFFIRILERFDGLENVRLCEIGSAYGEFLQLARFKGAKVVGVDLDDKAVAYTRDKLKIKSYNSLSSLSESQDVICSKSVFEHLPDPGKLLKDISRKLDIDGRLLISIPNGTNIEMIGPTWIGFRVDLEHLNYFTPRTLIHLLTKHGFYVEQHWEINQFATNRNKIANQSFVKRLISIFFSMGTWDPLRSGSATLVILARLTRRM
jgi:SAM-dependent methyltransferase